MKYGQEDLLNLWQMGFKSFTRLLLLSLSTGAVASLIWWSVRSPKDSFYYLFQYAYSSLYCFIPFGCSPVAVRNVQILQPLIDQLGELIRSCVSIFVLMSLFSGVGLRLFFLWYSDNLENARFVRGAKLLKAAELNKEINTARDPQDRLKYKPDAADLTLGREKVRLPASLTFRHMGIIGVSGTGKTQLISGILQQLALRPRQKCLILDLNGQYYSRFGQDEDKVLSLFDKRSEAWSFYGEKVPAEFFAQALVEVNESGNNKFFGSAGRALLTDIISQNTTIGGIWQDLTSPPTEILTKLTDGISPALLGAPEQAAGVIATTSVDMGFLRHLNWWNKSQEFFSLTDWVLSQSTEWVFLIVKDIDLAASRSLLRLWVDLVVGGVLQREENKDYPHLWVVCDELPGLGALPSLGKLLSQGRKYKATVAAGYQLRGQIRQLYGKDQAAEIFAGLQTKIIFRTLEPDASKEESLTLGEQEVEQVGSTGQLGGAWESDGHGLQRGVQTRPVVMPASLQNLADMKAYLKICEFNPCLISFDYQFLPPINEPSRQQTPPKPLVRQSPESSEAQKVSKGESIAEETTGQGEETSGQDEIQVQSQEGETDPVKENQSDTDTDQNWLWDFEPK